MSKIFINPGHAPDGNPDPGAVGPTGTRESDVAAAVGALVGNALNAAGCEAMSYQSDDLKGICDTSNTWGADLFVSIHCNAAENPAAKGVETWYIEGSTKGQVLAQAVQNQLVGLGAVDRGIKSGHLYVTLHTDAPAVLAEIGFISNPGEEANLANQECQQSIANAIARGVTDYLSRGE